MPDMRTNKKLKIKPPQEPKPLSAEEAKKLVTAFAEPADSHMNLKTPKKKRISHEPPIEDAIIARPDLLGFPRALAIRNFRVAPTSGAVDVVLIPPESESIRLVLVETKSARAPDAACKVVGQLLMYYAGALTFGSNGINILRQFASEFPDVALTTKRISPQKVIKHVTGESCDNTRCYEMLTEGTPRLSPPEVALFVALDDQPHKVLIPLLHMLRTVHSLPIGLAIAKGDILEIVPPPAG
jgi:hypothetical protein